MHSLLGREWYTLVEAGRTVVGEQRGEELPFGRPQVLVERGPADVEFGRQLLGREIDGPLLYNFVGDLGTSPYVDIDALDDLGFDLVIFHLPPEDQEKYEGSLGDEVRGN